MLTVSPLAYPFIFRTEPFFRITANVLPDPSVAVPFLTFAKAFPVVVSNWAFCVHHFPSRTREIITSASLEVALQ